MNASLIKKELHLFATDERKKTNEWFFKTGPGEYGSHDRFLGITNPQLRLVAKKYKNTTLDELQKIIVSQYNEERLCALIILVLQFSDKKADQKHKKRIYDFYIKNMDHINNWNLVDLSAPHIVGEYLFLHPQECSLMNDLVISSVQWKRRICILSTWAFIKRGDFTLALTYAKKLLCDDEDLMHKAVGWMLREVWKKDSKVCENFLRTYYDHIPRTTLRYAIEKMDEKKRIKYLHNKF